MAPSSMKIEFHDKNDLKQACYEATVDLTLYIAHLEDIAQRAAKFFPEVAAGLRGSADGLKQYLRGVDGEWRTPGNEALRKTLSGPQFEVHLWAYEFCRDPRGAVLIMGCLAAVAEAKPELTFWQALNEARGKLGDLQPLVEALLESSPRRTQ
jgi:hypothetical protein